MKSVRPTAATIITALIICVVGMFGPSHAGAVAPSALPDDSSLGGLYFLNSAGQQQTTGSLSDAPFVARAVAEGPGRTEDNKATLYFATPQSGTDAALWVSSKATPSVEYSNTTVPPTETGASGNTSLSTYIAANPNTDGPDAGLYEVRLRTSGPGVGLMIGWYAATIQVTLDGKSTAAVPSGTWSLVSPTGVPTTVGLSASPQTPGIVNNPLTLTATIATGGAGAVEFFSTTNDTVTDLGPGMYDATTGAATYTTTTGASGTTPTAAGTFSFRVEFTPDPTNTAQMPATSPYLNYVENSSVQPKPTATTLTAPASSPSGSAITLSGTVASADGSSPAGGSVSISDTLNGVVQVALDAPYVAAATHGTFTVTLTPVDGSHSYAATFTSTDTNFSNSIASTAVTTQVGDIATRIFLSTAPVSSSYYGNPVTLTATVTPVSTPGTVSFADGGVTLAGSVAYSPLTGVATLTTTALEGGRHSLSASFTPAAASGFLGVSTLPNVYSLTVNPRTTTVSLSASPTASVAVGSTVVLTALVSPAVSGLVEYFDGAADLGSADSYSPATGIATKSVKFTSAGNRSLSVQFIASTLADNTSNFSDGLPYMVSAQPVVTAQITTVTTTVVSGAQVRSGANSLPVSITATSSNGIKSVTVTMDGGVPDSLTAEGSRYSTKVSLLNIKLGTHTLTFRATDGVGNVTTSTSVFVLTVQSGVAAPNKTYAAGSVPGASNEGFSIKTKVSGAPGGFGRTATKAGSSISFSFYGNALTLHFIKNSTSGKVQLIVDGKKKTIDLYSAAGKAFLEKIQHLTYAKHKVQIIALGVKTSASKGNNVTFGYVLPAE